MTGKERLKGIFKSLLNYQNKRKAKKDEVKSGKLHIYFFIALKVYRSLNLICYSCREMSFDNLIWHHLFLRHNILGYIRPKRASIAFSLHCNKERKTFKKAARFSQQI